MISILKGLKRRPRTIGKDWFENQNDAAKEMILGKETFLAYKDNNLSLDDFVAFRNDKRFGKSVTRRPLAKILADKKIDLESNAMMNKDTRFSKIERPKALKILKKEMREQGVFIHSGEEAQSLLDYFAKQKGVAPENIHAVTLGDDIFVRLEYAENVRVLREEFIHTRQQRDGQSSHQIIEAEIEARKLLVKNRRAWEITDDEVREILAEIRQMKKTGRY